MANNKIKCAALAMIVSCGFGLSAMAQNVADYNIIPVPQSVVTKSAQPFVLKSGVVVTYPKGNVKMQNNAEFLAEYVKELTGIELKVVASAPKDGAINLTVTPTKEQKDGYTIENNGTRVTLCGNSEAGNFYAIQTLRKSLPAEKCTSVQLPAVSIKDAPRFEYRGMMLDCSRHFFPVSFVKKYIDILALHNENNMHWHLTDDQGWRFEVKKYPKLIEVGSNRDETVIGHNTGIYDGTPYGGYYTQEQCKEIVDYAAKRYINIVPEIDMPGHMLGALATYPELGCTGGPYKVWSQWGVSDDVLCAGNPKTIEFIKNVLAELIQVFPSKLIHVGGDECPKTRWKDCPKCQAKAKELGFVAGKHTVEEQLQSYIIKEAEKFLNANGRQMIGWDETLEGGLAPNAWIMSWRGMDGGIEAARQHHNVIMTPTSYVYFDYYQTLDQKSEPIAIGGYLPVKQVYNFDPIPAELSKEDSKYIIGAQANLWTEYIPSEGQVEYMVLPRMAALSEVQWMQPEQKNFEQFVKRVAHQMSIYDALGYNYAKHLLDVEVDLKPDTENGCLKAKMTTLDDTPIHYTLDGSEPTLQSPVYTKPLEIRESCEIKAAAIRPNGVGKVFDETINVSKSSFKPIKLLQFPSSNYTFSGETLLLDGMKGSHNFRTGRWMGFNGNDLEAVIDMKTATEISSLKYKTCVMTDEWVFDATNTKVEVSDDGVNFKTVAEETYGPQNEAVNQDVEHTLNFAPTKARYFKVTVGCVKVIPDWHGAKGKPGFLFVDEIELN